jgi:predicted GNAT superfamily acetyltransferase
MIVNKIDLVILYNRIINVSLSWVEWVFLVIKKLHTYEELKEVATIRSEIWPNDGEVALDHMKFISCHGGIILGAYQEEQLVGYIYSFPGYRANKVYLILQNIGVLPAYQHQKIGEALMQALKQEAQNLGYEEIVWTFEPLESVNAYVYLHKMGAITSEYIKNCYEDERNDFPIDRLLTRWDLTNSEQTPIEQLETIIAQSHKVPFDEEVDITDFADHSYLLIPVPAQFKAFRSRTEVHGWRFFTRSIFCQLFTHGWEVFDLHKNQNPDSKLHYYVARKKDK